MRGHPIVWSLALCPKDAKQDPVVYGAEFSVVLLVEGPRTASIQESLDCLGFYHSSLEGGRHFRLVVELSRRYLLMHIQHARNRLAISKNNK